MPASTSNFRRRATTIRKSLIKNRKKALAVIGSITAAAAAVNANAFEKIERTNRFVQGKSGDTIPGN